MINALTVDVEDYLDKTGNRLRALCRDFRFTAIREILGV